MDIYDHWQAVGPARPMSRVGSAQCAPETQTTQAQREAADFPSGTVGELSKKGTEALPNAGVMVPSE